MATVNKDFKVKNGLIVEGTTGTINNYDILTKNQDDQDYIVGLIGGTSTSSNTPNTVVKRDGSGNFAAGTITADLTGNVTGTVSSLSNHDTDDLSEGTTNKYYTDNRVKNVLTGSTQTNISITEVGGVLHITAENGVADSTTDDLDEGATNKYFTNARARQAISEGTGINYDNTTGVISADLGDFDTDDLVEGSYNKYFTTARIDDHLYGAMGINYDQGSISVNAGNDFNFTNGALGINRTTVDAWYDANGAASDVATDLTNHINDTSTHGVTGDIVGTSDIQSLSNKTFLGQTNFQSGGGAGGTANHIDVNGTTGDMTITSGYALNLTSANDLTITSNDGDIVLNPDGHAYLTSVSEGNKIASQSYVDNAVSGLDWKTAVNMISFTNIALSGSTPLTIDSHTASNGYRLLLAGQTTDSQNGIYDVAITGGSYTLTRSIDADAYAELVGAAVFVMEGTQYGQTSWVQGNSYLTDFTAQDWVQFSGSGSVVAGTGITVDGLEVSIDRTTVNTWYEPAGSVSNHASDTITHGVSGNIVGTSDSQTLTNKTIGDVLKFNDGSNNSTIDVDGNNLYVNANNNLTLSTANGDIVLNADGSSYLWNNSSSDNLIATHGWVEGLTTDSFDEGSTNQYFTTSRARQSVSGGTAINYDNTTGVISVDATQLDTDDIAEGMTNKYYTDGRVKSVLTNSTQTNISITEVAGQLVITAENGVADSTTDDLDEGVTNHYFTDNRAKDAAGYLLENATQSNISISYDEGTRQLTVTAENGVADSTTDDLDEGSTNLYFTNQRAIDALEGVTPNLPAVEINSIAKQVAASAAVATASTVNAYTWTKADYRSAKFLVKFETATHSEISEVLITLDGSDNVAITEYAIVGTNGNLGNVTADVSGSDVRLRVTTINNSTDVMVMGTLLV